MSEITYPLAPQGVYWTVQGEGHLAGEPMVFVRLAGCSVGCPGCDTDYRVAERVSVREIGRRVVRAETVNTHWVWLTGGEPTDHNLLDLLEELHGLEFNIALATAGVRRLTRQERALVDHLSVSPHSLSRWQQRAGAELKLVPGLNGLRLEDIEADLEANPTTFAHHYVQPLWGDADSLKACLDWVARKPGWRISFQGHKGYNLP